jgi:hypothetical protein
MPTVTEVFHRLHKNAQAGVSNALQSGEAIQIVIQGPGNQALIGTDRRVFVFKKGMHSGSFFSEQLNSWEYKNVSGIQLKKGMVGQAVVVEVPGVAPVTKTGHFDKGPNSAWEAPNAIMAVPSANLADVVNNMRQLIAQYHQHEREPIQVPVLPDPVDELRRYAALRDEGIISEQDFNDKKKRILGL